MASDKEITDMEEYQKKGNRNKCQSHSVYKQIIILRIYRL